MKFFPVIWTLPLACILFVGPLLPVPAQDTPEDDDSYEESIESERSFSLFGGATRKGPTAQWVYCNELVNAKKVKKAIRHCGYLVKTWPEHELADDAQRLQADLLFAEQEFEEAFDAYQKLIEQFSGRFDYNAVIQQQLETARRIEDREYVTLFGLSRFKKSKEAIPYYRQLIQNAPELEIAPDLLFHIGEILQTAEDYNEAIAEFEAVEQRYPGTTSALKASYQRARSMIAIADEFEQDYRAAENAWASISLFLNSYPGSRYAEAAFADQKRMHERMAKIQFEQAAFYELRGQNTKAALAAYHALVAEFPDSDWTRQAQSRIQALTSP